MDSKILLIIAIVCAIFFTMGGATEHATSAKKIEKFTGIKDIYLRSATVYEDEGISGKVIDEQETEYYIVQFSDNVQEDWKKEIKDLGGTIHEYIPENSFIIRMDKSVLEKVTELNFVGFVTPYGSKYKIAPELNLQAIEPDEEKTCEIILFRDSDPDSIISEIRSIATDVEVSRNRIRAKIEKEDIPQISRIKGVEWIEEFIEYEFTNDISAEILHVDYVWDTLGLDGEGQIVAVCDSGLDTGVNDATMHDDFEGRIVSIYALGRPGDASDDHFHGTHVAGSVLGNGVMSNGQIRGMAYKARLVFQSVLDYNMGLGGLPIDLNELFQQAYNDGARIHQNSWGSNALGIYTSHARDVDEFMWNNKDMTIVFSAGNEGVDANYDGVVDLGSMGPPGTAKNAITVGGTENLRNSGGNSPYSYGQLWSKDFGANPIASDLISDDTEGMVAFSSRGPTNDGRIKPDLVAPGTSVLSVQSQDPNAGHGAGVYNQYYCYSDGTSMSTPLTSGATTLVRQYYMDKKGLDNPKSALIKATLIHGAKDIIGQYSPCEAANIPNFNEGWGRVDLKNSLVATEPKVIEYSDSEYSLTTGQSKSFQYVVGGSDIPFKVTLVWTDYPGSVQSAKNLVNNLNLEVTTPGGGKYNGNDVIQPYDDHKDDVNNVERVQINNPATGTYTVSVAAENIPNGPQDFALIVSYGGSEVVTTGDVEYQSHVLDDDNDGGSYGDGNGIANPGEIFEMTVTLKNNMNIEAPDVAAELFSSDPYVLLFDEYKEFGNIQAGRTADSPFKYIFGVWYDCPHNHKITIGINITDSLNHKWTDTFDITVVDTTAPIAYNTQVTPEYTQVGNDITIKTSVLDGSSISSVIAEIESPDEFQIASLDLYDDGLHSDSDAGDLIYGNTFTTDAIGRDYLVDIKTRDSRGNIETFNNSGEFTTKIFKKKSNILLVDDDKGSSYESYYKNALKDKQYYYDIWTTDLFGSIGSDALNQYSDGIVIWFTGDDWNTTLTSLEQDALKSYLDKGGSLFISGQDIGYDLIGYTNQKSTFYTDYLHANFTYDTSGLDELEGAVGDEITDGLEIKIAGSDGADNQFYSSIITPLGEANSIFTYQGNVTISSSYKPSSFESGTSNVRGLNSRGLSRIKSSRFGQTLSETEITYDDNEVDAFTYMNNAGDGLFVKFTTSYNTLNSVKYYIYAYDYDCWFSDFTAEIYDDAGGQPGNLLYSTDVTCCSSGWLEVNIPDVSVGSTFWVGLIYKYYWGYPVIGGDTDAPIDGRSYYYDYLTGTLIQETGGDFMIRAVVSGTTVTTTTTTTTTTIPTAEGEIYYDDGVAENAFYWPNPAQGSAVHFTTTNKYLDKIKYYITSSPHNFYYQVYNSSGGNPSKVVVSGTTSPTSTGWHEVDLDDVKISSDFYVGIFWADSSHKPLLGEDTSEPDGRSLDWDGTQWSQWSTGDYMIRVVVSDQETVDCSPVVTSYNAFASVGDEIVINWSNPCTTSYSSIHLCGPYDTCDPVNNLYKYYSDPYSGPAGEFNVSFIPLVFGTWTFYVYNLDENNVSYNSKLYSIDVSGNIGGCGALKVNTGDYKVVYLAFGFEGINSSEMRVRLMERSVNWLNPSITKGGLLSAITVSPETSLSPNQSETFNYTSRVTCSGGSCENVTATLGIVSNKIVPMDSGTPFFTTSQNSIEPKDMECLQQMQNNDLCEVSWIVNVSGTSGSYQLVAMFDNGIYSGGSDGVNISIGGTCDLVGDNPPCSEVALSEVIDLINQWTAGNADLSDVIDLINAWASS